MIVNGRLFLCLVAQGIFFLGVAFALLVNLYMQSCIINFGRACFLLGPLCTISLDLLGSELSCALTIAGDGVKMMMKPKANEVMIDPGKVQQESFYFPIIR